MATSRGGADVRRFMLQLPAQLEQKVLRGAGRAAGKVIANEAKDRLGGREAEAANGTKVLIADALKVRTKQEPGRVVVRIQLKGPGAYVGRWLEYGTDPHLISAHDEVRGGMSINRINKSARGGELKIGDKFVGASVQHPGAERRPFLRISLDTRFDDAVAAAQSYINSRVTRKGIIGGPDAEGDNE
jgi:hypothetical protein